MDRKVGRGGLVREYPHRSRCLWQRKGLAQVRNKCHQWSAMVRGADNMIKFYVISLRNTHGWCPLCGVSRSDLLLLCNEVGRELESTIHTVSFLMGTGHSGHFFASPFLFRSIQVGVPLERIDVRHRSVQSLE